MKTEPGYGVASQPNNLLFLIHCCDKTILRGDCSMFMVFWVSSGSSKVKNDKSKRQAGAALCQAQVKKERNDGLT